ncbi:S-layer homology domain-containing protein [Bacillus sp. Marseille-P3661]|uniref:S-layer homology domain-containing protein n=1 Tax=Bacillus sp. Marseille-P3661 TaxID=1936234 RepID=UPI00215525A4|nr:S-layer homology domain-containing protein [Bacillus sp. Marseille-P3661]
MKLKRNRLAILLTILLVLQSFASAATASASVLGTKVADNSTKISPGVTYSSQAYEGSSTKQAVNQLTVDLNDPFTVLDVHIPNPINNTTTVTKVAQQNNREGNFVVGAANAGFFDTVSKYPINLIAKENKVINVGVFDLPITSPLNAPVAFGVNANGKAVIGEYNLRYDVRIGDFTQAIKKVNTTRTEGSVVLYTKANQTTGSNEWGTEIIITDVSPSPSSMEVGSKMIGTVSKVVRFGQAGNSTVPANGLVLSAHGSEWAEKLKNITEGDSVQVELGLGDVWQDAKYVIGTGPLLVKNGQVSISMDEAQAFSKGRNPRTAIATNQAGDKVFIITIDGRQSGYSNGVGLRDLANHLISLGAYNAINLDGGGSTQMAVRQLGSSQPTLANQPSDNWQRPVSTVLQVISTAPTSDPKTIKLSKPAGKILKGTPIDITVDYVIDQYMNPVAFSPSAITLSAEGGIGSTEGMKFIAENVGTGKVVAHYNGGVGELPLTVVDTFDKLEISPKSAVVGVNETVQFSGKASNNNGEPLLFDTSLIKWSVEGDIGSITADGKFTAGAKKSSGYIVATFGQVQAKVAVQVGADPVLIDGFEDLAKWSADQAKATASIAKSASGEPVKQGSSSLKLTYDFTTAEEGTKAAYAKLINPITIQGNPKAIGLWVYGDGAGHWLRGTISDGTGKQHAISFTEEGELTWKGWKYVQAKVPANLPLPLKFDRIYVAETVKEKQNSGVIYLDKLQSVYVDNYTEVSFKDVSSDHWAIGSITFLSDRNTIRGYEDGTFRPGAQITRAQAAAMIARELKLEAANDIELKFTDVPEKHYAINDIKKVAAAGIITGKSADTFAPDEPLTRAEMAVVLNRAYSLQGEAENKFTDVKDNHWAIKSIKALVANDITGGYPDGTFKPSAPTTRAEFSSFMERVIKLAK